jgi:microcystin-dependent protein
LTGLQGERGLTGLTGPVGPQGPIGITGAAGPVGEQGLIGPQGELGPTGLTGPVGPQGPIGLVGGNGKNSLIKTTSEPAGSNCTNGGIKFELGLDLNNNLILDFSEIDNNLTQYICIPETTSSSSSLPVGTIISFAGNSIPTGWLVCDGSEKSRSTYSTLFNSLGVSWGQGDGATTFNLPDLRGRFLRGVDGGAGNDPDKESRILLHSGGNVGDNVGSYQNDEFKSHKHGLRPWGGTMTGFQTGGIRADPSADGLHSTDFSGGSETRPKNAYVHYIIKSN